MISPDWVGGLGGGALVGLASVALLVLDGRIAGVSGILGGLLSSPGDRPWRLAFLGGLPLGAGIVAALAGGLPQVMQGSPGLLVFAGLLVGLGTRLGAGCTSGHGICGLARRSPRSVAATLTFMAAGMLTVFVVRQLMP
ncbi:MAG: YeeE/YedE family protein [Chromatiales bacterium]|jgi:uncharacterized membrane protein YedE/YeeE|nr:MAG: YeeE/YedE family protein [Chromatiales bacterium]